jgi:DMSO/TMAO reductase YedYZ molybdopterin-dependent catalytic subunit
MVERLPSGQRWLDEPIVYDVANVPPVNLSTYVLSVLGAVAHPAALSWEELLSLPCVELVRDFHCVTTWSVRDIKWEGVRTRELVDRVAPDPDARWVLVSGRDGYTTNMPIEDFSRPDSLLAYRMNGAEIPPDHGHPLRLVVPALYAWKSAKYVERIEFLTHLKRGYWEERGYHDRGDPWREERYRV